MNLSNRGAARRNHYPVAGSRRLRAAAVSSGTSLGNKETGNDADFQPNNADSPSAQPQLTIRIEAERPCSNY
jgi:hypothetical protein